MITLTECITIDYTEEQMPESKDIVKWFTDQGWSYDADTGILMQGTDKVYINIYKQKQKTEEVLHIVHKAVSLIFHGGT